MIIKQISGDLFSSNDNLVHCVSQDLNMGKGIATEFKKRFGQLDNLKQQVDLSKHGQMIYIIDPAKNKLQERYIFYLVTKPKYWNKPTYESLTNALLSLHEFCKLNNVQTLSMPRIGCGLDRLEYYKVYEIIEKIFSDTNITIQIYFLN